MVLGAQLYTVRHYTQSARDFDIAMKKIAEIGYRTVQISAIGNIPAEQVREICDRHALEIVLTHTSPDRILNDTQAVIREHDAMGCTYIGLGSMPDRYRTVAWLDRFFADFKEPARKIADAGKLLMYHNHDFEFEALGKTRIIERLMAEFTPQEMGFTLDTYWVQTAGADVCQWIEKLAGRLPCVHLKDRAVVRATPVMAPVGEGNMNFPAILDAVEKFGGTRYLLVEQDECLESPFVCLKKSFDYLTDLGYR